MTSILLSELFKDVPQQKHKKLGMEYAFKFGVIKKFRNFRRLPGDRLLQ